MHFERIVEFIRRQPFQSFDIKMSDGRVYSVDHPEFVSVSRNGHVVVYQTEDDRTLFLDMHHITTLEVSNRPAAA